jgi:SPP1 family predicted phage head-tail adaptor
MAASQLKTPVTFSQRTGTKDSAGQPVDDWVTFATTWADVRFASGMETIKSDRDVSISRASAVIRRRPEIVAGMRITINSVAFDILDVMPDLKRRMYMTLICESAR